MSGSIKVPTTTFGQSAGYPGNQRGFHDHGESAGAFVVATGILEEPRSEEQALVIPPGGRPHSVPITHMTSVTSPSRRPLAFTPIRLRSPI